MKITYIGYLLFGGIVVPIKDNEPDHDHSSRKIFVILLQTYLKRDVIDEDYHKLRFTYGNCVMNYKDFNTSKIRKWL